MPAEEAPTSIAAPNAVRAVNTGYKGYYSLEGIRYDHPQKGVNITNGKKVVIKWEKNWARSGSSERERARTKFKVVIKWEKSRSY